MGRIQPERRARAGRRFTTTSWTLVLEARKGAETEAREALAQLCEAYWYPLYAFVRRQGYSVEEAEDLTQGFFAVLIEKEYLQDLRPEEGRFRNFLLASLRHFLSKERDKERALKRGGGAPRVSIDTDLAERHYAAEASDAPSPEAAYERRWALTVLERALARLGEEMSDEDRRERFECLRPYLTGSTPKTPYGDVGAELGMSEGAMKTAVHRLRGRLGELLRAEIAATVADPGTIDDEVRHLLNVVRPWEPHAPA